MKRHLALALLVGIVLVSCGRGPGQVPSVQKVINVEADAFSIVGPDAEATYPMPEIGALSTVTAFIDRGTGGEKWVALPFAYQAPDKTAAIVTYHYQEGSFTVSVVSPVEWMRDAIVSRIDGHRVKVIIDR